jgi:hypothetical protein
MSMTSRSWPRTAGRTTLAAFRTPVSLPIGGSVRIRMRFRDFLGTFVYHCHILAHEDAGKMGVVEVTRTRRRPNATAMRELRTMRAGMAGGHGHPDG